MSIDWRLQAVPNDCDTSWILDAVLPFETFAVGSLIPLVFEAYGRILHPALGRDGAPVRWDEVAAWSGRTAHPLAEFDLLAVPRGEPVGPAPFEHRPTDGALPPEALIALSQGLAAHTTTPDSCFVGVWEGYGWIKAWEGRTLRLPLQERIHFVFSGPLGAAAELGWTNTNGSFVREAPSLIWPADRAWFVSSDVDQDSTFVGGSSALLAALQADPRLEAWPVMPTDPITAGTDTLNLE
jgi:hypothetical protein